MDQPCLQLSHDYPSNQFLWPKAELRIGKDRLGWVRLGHCLFRIGLRVSRNKSIKEIISRLS